MTTVFGSIVTTSGSVRVNHYETNIAQWDGSSRPRRWRRKWAYAAESVFAVLFRPRVNRWTQNPASVGHPRARRGFDLICHPHQRCSGGFVPRTEQLMRNAACQKSTLQKTFALPKNFEPPFSSFLEIQDVGLIHYRIPQEVCCYRLIGACASRIAWLVAAAGYLPIPEIMPSTVARKRIRKPLNGRSE